MEMFKCPECGATNIIDETHKPGEHRCFRCGFPVKLINSNGKLEVIWNEENICKHRTKNRYIE
jgi:DNA-directed RNA polymerase subunit RPC12/RpoP